MKSDKQRKVQVKPAVERLLYSREQTAEALGGVSVMTIIRLEKARVLRPERLGNAALGKVFYRAGDVMAVVERRQRSDAA